MPFIRSKVSCAISPAQEEELKRRFGTAIALVPGKSEAYLLLSFEPNCHLWLRGEHNAPIAYVEVSLFGTEEHLGYDALTKALTNALTAVLGIQPDRVYIHYEDLPAWGVGGEYIDRRMFR